MEKCLETVETHFSCPADILLDISRVINSNLGISEIFRVVYTYLPYLIDFDLGGYYLSDTNNFRLKQSLALEEEYVSPLGQKNTQNLLLNKIQTTCRPWICSHFIASRQLKKHLFYRDVLAPNGIFYTEGAPILVNGRLVGSINLGRNVQKGDFTEEELNRLEMVANMLSTLVHGFSRAYYHNEFDCPLEECESAPLEVPGGGEIGDRQGWMNILGNMTTVVAREIRNPLVAMKMAFYSLARSVPNEPGLQPDLEQMEQSLYRMNKSLDFMLSLSRDLELNFVQVDINRFLDEILQMISSTLDPEVFIVRDYAPLPPIILDREKMIAVLNNIIKNAIDAMPGGGTLRIITISSNGKVGIIIEDNGLGVDQNMRSRLFSPFVSSKPQGTGLGLTICKRIVEAHGGNIKVRSNIGKGTAVCIDLPIREG